MHLEVITPDSKIFDGDIKSISVPGTKAPFAVLKNHAPVISTLEKGIIKIVAGDDEVFFYNIDGGIIEVRDNHVILLAESIPLDEE